MDTIAILIAEKKYQCSTLSIKPPLTVICAVVPRVSVRQKPFEFTITLPLLITTLLLLLGTAFLLQLPAVPHTLLIAPVHTLGELNIRSKFTAYSLAPAHVGSTSQFTDHVIIPRRSG